TLDNDGTISASSGTLALQGGDGGAAETGTFGATGGATVQFASGTYTLAHPAATSPGFTGGVRIDGGIVDVAAGKTFSASGTTTLNGGQIGGAGTFDVKPSGTLAWQSGTMPDGGTTLVEGSTTVTGAAALSTGRTFENDGTFSQQGGNVYGDSDTTFVNRGVYDIQDDFGYALNSGVENPVFQNAGTLRKSGGTGTSMLNVRFSNSGVVLRQTGTLVITGEEETTQSASPQSPASTGSTTSPSDPVNTTVVPPVSEP